MSTTPAGNVDTSSGKATLEFTRFLARTPEQVWVTLTDPKEFGAWYNAEAEIEPKEGGTFTVHSGPFHWSGKIVAWEPNKLFKYEHNHEPVTEMPGGEQTMVTWELTPKDGGTELRFTQSGLSSTAGFAPGTHVVVDRLVAHAEGKDMPDFNDYYTEVEPLYPEWHAA